jgi:hypothetical protein
MEHGAAVRCMWTTIGVPKIMAPIRVMLTPQQVERARSFAQFAREESRRIGCTDRLAGRPEVDDGGYCGELAWHEGLGLEWEPRVNSFKDPDYGRNVQIRCSRCRKEYPPLDFGRMSVKPNDNPAHNYTLIVGHAPNYLIQGWMPGSDARNDKYWDKVGDEQSGGWFVPQADLNRNMSELLRLQV